LDQLRIALRGADPALVQDALYDAEDHLRSEMTENPGKTEAEILAKIATTYGAPEEVAGIFYFVWAVAGLSISIGTSILIFGLAFAVLFFGTVRVLSLVEGRIIEVMLGERMPRRPVYAERGKPFMTRIKEMFTDPRTWSTLLYMVLMLPLGIVYFTTAVTGITLSLACMVAPVAIALREVGILDDGGIYWNDQLF